MSISHFSICSYVFPCSTTQSLHELQHDVHGAIPSLRVLHQEHPIFHFAMHIYFGLLWSDGELPCRAPATWSERLRASPSLPVGASSKSERSELPASSAASKKGSPNIPLKMSWNLGHASGSQHFQMYCRSRIPSRSCSLLDMRRMHSRASARSMFLLQCGKVCKKPLPYSATSDARPDRFSSADMSLRVQSTAGSAMASC